MATDGPFATPWPLTTTGAVATPHLLAITWPLEYALAGGYTWSDGYKLVNG